MKVIIAGSRGITDYRIVLRAIYHSGYRNLITQVISGGARGVDTLGEKCAYILGIQVKRFRADWDRYGKGAGHIRNEQMGDYADGLIAIWDGKSKGTKHMIDYATRLGLMVYVENIK